MVFDIKKMIRTRSVAKFHAKRSKTTNFGRHFDYWLSNRANTWACVTGKQGKTWQKPWRTWLVLCALICLLSIVSPFIYKLNCLLDKATDPSKSQEGVDCTTPVCDRINLDLDGWGPLILAQIFRYFSQPLTRQLNYITVCFLVH